MLRSLPLLLAVLLLPVSARSAPPPGDADGDPLPDGVIARFGTAHFRDGHGLRSVALSSDGCLLATLNYTGLRLWDVTNGRQVRNFDDLGNGWSRVVLSSDGRLLVALPWTHCDNEKHYISFWDTATGKAREPLVLREDGLTDFVLSADGCFLTAGRSIRTDVRGPCVWEIASGKKFGPFPVVQSGHASAAVSPNGHILATWGEPSKDLPRADETDQVERTTVQFWDVTAGIEMGRVSMGGAPVTRVSFASDGRSLAIASEEVISIRETTTLKERVRLRGRLGQGARLVFSPDCQTLAGLSYNRVVQEWDLVSGRRRNTYTAMPECSDADLLYRPDGLLMSWGRRGVEPLFWDVRAGRTLSPPGRQGSVGIVQFLDGGASLAVVSDCDQIEFWDVAKRRQRLVRAVPTYFSGCINCGMAATCVSALSPTGKQFAVSLPRGAHLFELPSVEETGPLEAAWDLTPIAFSADGKRVASCGRDATVAVHDTETSEKLWESTGEERDRAWSAAFSPDGSLVAIATEEGDVHLCSAATGKVLRWWKEQQGVAHLAFSPDGKLLAADSQDGAVSLWNTATGRLVRRMKGFEDDWSINLLFTPDGRFLIGASQKQERTNGVLLIWEVATGKLRHKVTGHRGWISSLDISPDGKLLATGGSDTTVLLWDLAALTK